MRNYRHSSVNPWLTCVIAYTVIASVTLTGGTGCQGPGRNTAKARIERGLVIVLPGIEGRSVWNRNIADGLDRGGVASAIEIYDWTSAIPGNFVYNLTNLERNRRQADNVAQYLSDYHVAFPGRPIHLVGHSGGGGIAVMALEALPQDLLVEQVILLAPALSPGYDLTTALKQTRFGIVSFYSERDISLLKVGTSVLGPIDREFGASAGAVGFETPTSLSAPARSLYKERLRQVRWTQHLKAKGADGSHLGWASKEFARDYLAALIIRTEAARPLPARLVSPDKR